MAKKDEKNIKDKTSFIKSFKAELKKVIWPTPKQLFNNTVAVLTIVIITAVIVFVLDFAFESINKYGIDKVKEVVANQVSNEVTNSSDETVDSENQVSEDVENNDATDNNETNNVE